MSETFDENTTAVTADRLLQENVDFQRAFMTMVTARRLYSHALSELQTMLTDLPPGFSDDVPAEFSPKQRGSLLDFFVSLAVARESAGGNTDELTSAVGSFVLPWVRETGLRRRTELAKEQRWQHKAEWQKRADTPVRLPFQLTIDAKKGRLCSRSRPLLFVVPSSSSAGFSDWLAKGLEKENKTYRKLKFATETFSGELPYDKWAGQLHSRDFMARLSPYESNTDLSKIPDIVFIPDLMCGQIPQEDMSLATYVNELNRWVSQWSQRWSALCVSCLYLDEMHYADRVQMLRLDLLRTYYTVLYVSQDASGFQIGRYPLVS